MWEDAVNCCEYIVRHENMYVPGIQTPTRCHSRFLERLLVSRSVAAVLKLAPGPDGPNSAAFDGLRGSHVCQRGMLEFGDGMKCKRCRDLNVCARGEGRGEDMHTKS